MLRSRHQILNRNSETVNSNSATFPMTTQLAHLADSIRHTQYGSRNKICEIRDTRCEIRTNLCKTNPICTNPEYASTSFLAKAYGKTTKFSPAKANPNKPKQSQYDPHFSPVRGPRSQNEPKQTQSNPISLSPTERRQPPISQRLAELHKKSQNFLRFLLHRSAYSAIL
jgi:hypothetical protein